jgi:hypothetical protein
MPLHGLDVLVQLPRQLKIAGDVFGAVALKCPVVEFGVSHASHQKAPSLESVVSNSTPTKYRADLI